MTKLKPLTQKDGCACCECYTAKPRETFGTCRRYPPTLIVKEDDISVMQPPVEAEDWCAEFRRRFSA